LGATSSGGSIASSGLIIIGNGLSLTALSGSVALTNPSNVISGSVQVQGLTKQVLSTRGDLSTPANSSPDAGVTLAYVMGNAEQTLPDVKTVVANPASGTITSANGWVVADTSALAGRDTSSVIRLVAEPLVVRTPEVLPVGQAFKLDLGSLGARRITSLSLVLESGFTPGATTLEAGSVGNLTIAVDNATGRATITGDGTAEEYDRAVKTLALRLDKGAGRPDSIDLRLTLTDSTGAKESRTIKLTGGASRTRNAPAPTRAYTRANR
jgi:hypothetical protein